MSPKQVSIAYFDLLNYDVFKDVGVIKHFTTTLNFKYIINYLDIDLELIQIINIYAHLKIIIINCLRVLIIVIMINLWTIVFVEHNSLS